jgi:hypothetical protein
MYIAPPFPLTAFESLIFIGTVLTLTIKLAVVASFAYINPPSVAARDFTTFSLLRTVVDAPSI